MSEYIERDAVKVMLKRECSPRVMAYLVDELCEIPAADVRPVVRGKWIKQEDDACFCSVCQLGLSSFIEGIFYNYCPFCGADMRAEPPKEE